MTEKPHAPKRDVFLVLTESGKDCLCVTSLDDLHAHERLDSDRVYRVLTMEPVEDPRS